MSTARMLQRLQLGFCEAGEQKAIPVTGTERVDVDGVLRGRCWRCDRLVGVDGQGRMKSHKFQGQGA